MHVFVEDLVRLLTIFSSLGKLQFRVTVTTDKRVHHFDYNGQGCVVVHVFKNVGSKEVHREALLLEEFVKIFEDICATGFIWKDGDIVEVVKDVHGSMLCRLFEVRQI